MVTKLCSQSFSLENDSVCLAFFIGHIAQGRIHFHMCHTFPCSFDVDVFSPAHSIEIYEFIMRVIWKEVDFYLHPGIQVEAFSVPPIGPIPAGIWAQGFENSGHALLPLCYILNHNICLLFGLSSLFTFNVICYIFNNMKLTST
jgi:hypothetical protein